MTRAERIMFGGLTLVLVLFSAAFSLLSGWALLPPTGSAGRSAPHLALAVAFGIGAAASALKALNRSARSWWLLAGPALPICLVVLLVWA